MIFIAAVLVIAVISAIVSAIVLYKPWAVVFGNHDSQGNASRDELAEFFLKSEYCIFAKGPDDLSGVCESDPFAQKMQKGADLIILKEDGTLTIQQIYNEFPYNVVY